MGQILWFRISSRACVSMLCCLSMFGGGLLRTVRKEMRSSEEPCSIAAVCTREQLEALSVSLVLVRVIFSCVPVNETSAMAWARSFLRPWCVEQHSVQQGAHACTAPVGHLTFQHPTIAATSNATIAWLGKVLQYRSLLSQAAAATHLSQCMAAVSLHTSKCVQQLHVLTAPLSIVMAPCAGLS
jgi:hypothetical protein